MEKVISLEEAVDKVEDGMTIMVGGFLAVGTPPNLVDALVKKGVRDLTVIANDTCYPGVGLGKLLINRQIKKLIASHIGTNPDNERLMNAGEMEIELVPQGTLAERIRCGGYGLGGFLTPTGVGTIVADGKQEMVVNGRTYLLEMPLHADVALLGAHRADKYGNLTFWRASRNFNTVMAFAADVVIAEAPTLVETGEISPEEVIVTGVVVDHVVHANGGCC